MLFLPSLSRIPILCDPIISVNVIAEKIAALQRRCLFKQKYDFPSHSYL